MTTTRPGACTTPQSSCSTMASQPRLRPWEPPAWPERPGPEFDGMLISCGREGEAAQPPRPNLVEEHLHRHPRGCSRPPLSSRQLHCTTTAGFFLSSSPASPTPSPNHRPHLTCARSRSRPIPWPPDNEEEVGSRTSEDFSGAAAAHMGIDGRERTELRPRAVGWTDGRREELRCQPHEEEEETRGRGRRERKCSQIFSMLIFYFSFFN